MNVEKVTKEIIELLGLEDKFVRRRDWSEARIKTAWGTKTRAGFAASIRSILDSAEEKMVHVTLEQSGGLVDVLGKPPVGVALSLMDYDIGDTEDEELCHCPEGVNFGRTKQAHIHRSLDGDLI
jgi:hypothetical protein